MTAECFLTPVPREEMIYLGAFRNTIISFAAKPGPYFTARLKLMSHGVGIFKGICERNHRMIIEQETHRSVYSVLEIMPTPKVDAVRSSAVFSDLELNNWNNFRLFYFESADLFGIIYTQPLYNAATKVKAEWKKHFQEPVTVRPTLSNASLLK